METEHNILFTKIPPFFTVAPTNTHFTLAQGERKKQENVWKSKMFVLYYHKEGEPYVEWCQVEKRRMEVERERWKGEVREMAKELGLPNKDRRDSQGLWR